MSPLLFLLLLSTTTTNAYFSDKFRTFLLSNYPYEIVKSLTRTDIGNGSSFGGGDHEAGKQTKFRPVIIVHGITNTASNFLAIRNHFHKNRYNASEVYGMTYGNGGVTSVVFVKMECEYMRNVSWLKGRCKHEGGFR